jgi:hypothetical protein
LQRFQSLFSRIFDARLRVDNPFFWRTKTDVVETIARLGMADQIAHTRSCADVHNQTKQHVHCGRCSQCIDRRFAVLAAGLERFDPAEAYRVDLMTGIRSRVEDKEAALSYVRSALGYEMISGTELMSRYPAILDAVDHLREPSDAALIRLAGLLQRHGQAVTKVMRRELGVRRPDDFTAESLPQMFGQLQRAQAWPDAPAFASAPETSQPRNTFELVIDRNSECALIDGVVTITGATYRLLSVLAEEHLTGAGQGLDLLDYPTLRGDALAARLTLIDDAAVRQSVSRSRRQLAHKFDSAGLVAEDGEALIENIAWQGYRLAPDRVTVRFASSK